MKHMSPEAFEHAEPTLLKINVGSGSHAYNEQHKKSFEESDAFEVEDEFEDDETTVDEEVSAAQLESESAPRWDTEVAVDSVDEMSNESEVISKNEGFESIEDGAFMISAEVVRAYGLQYPGGYMAFEKDFQTKWVQPIQNPLGEENQSKKSAKNKMDVFTQFSHVTLDEFNEVVNLDEAALDEYLAEHHMDKDDFENWKLVIKYWEDADDLAFDNETLVADIAKGAFAAELEKEKVK